MNDYISQYNLSYHLIGTKSEFDIEYSPDYGNLLKSLTGFDGSNGFCFVSEKKLIFITDGRYILQAENQLKKLDADFKILNMHDVNFKSDLTSSFATTVRVGYNSRAFTKSTIKLLESNNIIYIPLEFRRKTFLNIPINKRAAFLYDEHEVSYKDKISLVTSKLKNDYYLFNNPSSICWLLNIRGQDIDYNLVFLCYGILEKSTGILTIFCEDPSHLEVISQYRKVEIEDLKYLESELKGIIKRGKSLGASDKLTIYYHNLLNKKIEIEEDYCSKLRSIKTEIEIEDSKRIHIEDGLAFINWWFSFEEKIKQNIKVDELSVSKDLEESRRERKDFFILSFETIVGFNENGAIIHYRPIAETNKRIAGNGLLLLDSGGHYFGGTTDVTRVIAIGDEHTDEQKRHYTLVLKAHLRLLDYFFPKNIPLHQLNSIGRYELWNEGLDFDHGLGHGVSNFIEVHEPPYSINSRCTEGLIENIILSNEPGLYFPNEYGIRIENLMYSRSVISESGKEFIYFENLTMIPYDLRLINVDLLSEKEISQINNYHEQIYLLFQNKVDDEMRDWLDKKTQKINR